MFSSFYKMFLVLLTSLFLFTGCETMEGFGEDVEDAGEEIEEEAD